MTSFPVNNFISFFHLSLHGGSLPFGCPHLPPGKSQEARLNSTLANEQDYRDKKREEVLLRAAAMSSLADSHTVG